MADGDSDSDEVVISGSAQKHSVFNLATLAHAMDDEYVFFTPSFSLLFGFNVNYRVSKSTDIASGSSPGQRFVRSLISQIYINTPFTSSSVQQIDAGNPYKKRGGKEKYVYFWSFLFSIFSKIFCHRTLESLSVKSLNRVAFMAEKAMTTNGRPKAHVPQHCLISFSRIHLILFC